MKRVFIAAIMLLSVVFNCIGEVIAAEVSDSPENNSTNAGVLINKNIISKKEEINMINLTIGEKVLTATIVDNSTTKALLKNSRKARLQYR